MAAGSKPKYWQQPSEEWVHQKAENKLVLAEIEGLWQHLDTKQFQMQLKDLLQQLENDAGEDRTTIWQQAGAQAGRVPSLAAGSKPASTPQQDVIPGI